MSSRVRIYELAGEAGLKSKDLADRLIQLGYAIKGHSSTVDEGTAEEIRRKVLPQMTEEIASRKLGGKPRQQPPKVRRRAAGVTVRRRRKAAPASGETAPGEGAADTGGRDEGLPQDEGAAPGVPPEDGAGTEQRPETDADAASRGTADTAGASGAAADAAEEPAAKPQAPRREGQDGGETGADGETPAAGEGAEDAQAAGTDAGATPVKAPGGEAEETAAGNEDRTAEAASAADTGSTDQAAAPASKRRKGLAKVIKRAAIVLPQEGPSRPAPSPRQAGGPTDRPARPAKGKKKGKRTVQFQPSGPDARNRRGGRGGRRGERRDYGRGGYDMRERRMRKVRKKQQKSSTPITESKAIKRRIKVYDTISVADLAKRMGVKASEVIAKLMGLGVMATINQALDVDTATVVASEFNFDVEQGMTEEHEVEQLRDQESGGEPVPRPPVVTVMGHVDHGKTSILDAIRKTDVASGEAGGITQHIGAYHVGTPHGDIVFLDTPGHAAFTEMRARGAKVTDIVVLVVAADDGVMDQTREAVSHAQAAEVPIVVAVNKIDKDNADPDRVIRELAELGLTPEEWGGDTMYCKVSAKKNIGIDELLETIHLQAEILELKADPERAARGYVVEAQLHTGRGPVATVLIQEGTLRTGDHFVVGLHHGRVRSMTNDRNQVVKEAGPAMPVEVQGLSGVPNAGDEFIVVRDEKMAKNVSQKRIQKSREAELASASKVSLENLFEKMAEADVMELRVIIRSDVQGTLEAFGQAAEKLSTDKVKVRRLHEGTGTITESDVHLAAASDAILIGFNVRPSVKVKELAEEKGVDIRTYDVIYHALEDIEKAMTGMLEPTFEERVIGTAEVRQTFSVPKVGTIAGCLVVDGKMERNAGVRVIRDGVVVYTGKLSSLKRFKDDAREVLTGFECGIGVENFNDIKVGDVIEAFVLDEVEATL